MSVKRGDEVYCCHGAANGATSIVEHDPGCGYRRMQEAMPKGEGPQAEAITLWRGQKNILLVKGLTMSEANSDRFLRAVSGLAEFMADPTQEIYVLALTDGVDVEVLKVEPDGDQAG